MEQQPLAGDAFAIDDWVNDARAVIQRIGETGRELLEVHGAASPRAAETAEAWRLAERVEEGQAALASFLESAEAIVRGAISLEAILRSAVAETASPENPDWAPAMVTQARLLDETLPAIDAAFVTIRHSALDLLRWSRRSGQLEGSDLSDRYRAGFIELTSHAPSFDAQAATLEEELAFLGERHPDSPEIAGLREALARQYGLRDRFRGFLQSVVRPTLDLVFEETDRFLEDWAAYPEPAKAHLATEFNDCCQLLLYHPPGFRRRVETIRPPLSGGMEASLYQLSEGDDRVLFLVDEDPVFESLTVTLLRVVPVGELDAAIDETVQSLYREFLLES